MGREVARDRSRVFLGDGTPAPLGLPLLTGTGGSRRRGSQPPPATAQVGHFGPATFIFQMSF